MLDGGTIVHVAQNLVREDALQLLAGLVKFLKLHGREVVKVVTVRAYEMAEDRAWNDGILTLQTTDNLVDVFLGVKAETVHTSIELDMYGPTRNTLLLSSMDEGIHQTERIHLGFEVVVEHGLEGRHLRVHNHNILRDAIPAQGSTLVSHGDSEVVDTMVL